MSTRQDLIHVSGGDLVMGSDGFYPEESPITRVPIDDLLIQSTLVTNAEFSDFVAHVGYVTTCLLYTSPSPRDRQKSRMPSSA